MEPLLDDVDYNIIGDINDEFTGAFEGGGHTIENLRVHAPTSSHVGMFGRNSDSAKVANLGLKGVDIDGLNAVGGLVGTNFGEITNSYTTGSVGDGWASVGGLVGNNLGDITNSYATGSVNGIYYVGGLVGMNSGGITNSYATGSVHGSESGAPNVGRLGGLVGLNRGDITNSHATGSVVGIYSRTAGLVGVNGGNITNAYATGSVNGTHWGGGLVGVNSGDITNAYATGSVNGTSTVGGLAGVNHGDITNAYAAGSVNGDSRVGGLVGHNESGGGATASLSFWDSDINDGLDGVGEGDGQGVIGLPTEKFDDSEDDFTDADWGFDDIWTIAIAPDGFERPIFQRQIIDGCNPYASPFGGGEGDDSNDPYLLCSAKQINNIGDGTDHLDNHFRLVTDVDMAPLLEDEDYNIIGDDTNQFSGTFNGDGHAIENLRIDANFPVGMFGVLGNSATVENVKFKAANVRGVSNVGVLAGIIRGGAINEVSLIDSSIEIGEDTGGGLVGWSEGGEIRRSYATGISVEFGDGSSWSPEYFGGLVGRNSGKIIESYVTDSVVEVDDPTAPDATSVGGLAGINDASAEITESYVTDSNVHNGQSETGGLVGLNLGKITKSHVTHSNIEGNDQVGGLVGRNSGDGLIAESYAAASVAGNRHVGGLVGELFEASIANTYALGDVEGAEKVGGLVGINHGVSSDSGTIENSYSAGRVNEDTTDADDVGGLVGENTANGEVNHSFWDKETSGQDDGIGSDDDDGVIGLNTDDFGEQSNFDDSDDADWDFDDIWEIGTIPGDIDPRGEDTNRPILQWQDD